MPDWQRISLGAPAAEFDIAQGLEQYFVESRLFEQVRSGEKRVILGPRGSGKSAIFKILAKRERLRRDRPSIIEISPEDYTYEVLGEVLTKELGGHWHKRSAFSSAWKFTLYSLIINEIIYNHKSDQKSNRQKALQEISTFAEKHGILKTKENLFSILTKRVKQLEEVKIGIAGVEGGARFRADEIQRLYKLSDLQSILPHIDNYLDEHETIIMVDELDKGWDASEDARNFVSGLFSAAMDLNARHLNLRVLISLRQELYRSMPELSDDIQKYRNLIAEIEWDEPDLLELIAKRIQKALSLSNKEVAHDIWCQLFEEILAYRRNNSFNYIVDRTQLRPREIIQFCTNCFEVASNNIELIDYGVIVEAEKKFSEDRTHDIASEYKYQFPGLLYLFETFRGMPYSLSREEVEQHVLRVLCGEFDLKEAHDWIMTSDIDPLIDILWRVGFLKALAVGGVRGRVRSGSRYVGSYQVSTMGLDRVNAFSVHPVFRMYLGLREKKGAAV